MTTLRRPSRLSLFRKADALGESLVEGNFLNLTEAELNQHIYRIMRKSFVKRVQGSPFRCQRVNFG